MSIPFGGEIPFVMYLAGTSIPAPGVSPTVEIRKAGSTFAAAVGAIIPVGHGAYCVAANIRDTDTPGVLILSATADGCDPTVQPYIVAPEVLPNDMRKSEGLLRDAVTALQSLVRRKF